MNHDEKTGSWSSVKQKIKTKFGKFSETELEGFNGHLDQLPAKVQKMYGYDKEKAERECKEFVKA